MNERNPYEFENIPDFAMQPAREKSVQEPESTFDPEVYERLLAGLELFETEPESEPELQNLPVESRASEEVPAQAEEVPEPTANIRKTENRGEVIPVGEGVLVDHLQLVEMVPCEPIWIRVEKDILVPDTKPDLESILSMDGTLQFTEREGTIRGDLILQTLYTPQRKGAERAVIDMESRIAFRQENGSGALQSAEMQEAGYLGMRTDARIESLEHSVINERKYRIKAVIAMENRRYRRRELKLFNGLKEDEVQLLQETVTVTDVTRRKMELLELEEELPLPDSLPEPMKLLRCDVTLVENHKQINRDKVVISGTAYYTVLYLPKEGEANSGGSGAMAAERTESEPVLFQTKSEFTQFVPLDRRKKENSDPGLGAQNDSASCRIFFRVQKTTAEPKENDSGIKNAIRVKVEGETFLELYREVERHVVTDAYHHQKELVFETEPVEMMRLSSCGIGETTVREVVSVPEQISGVKTILFLSGNLKNVESRVEGGKNIAEGQVETRLVCLSDEETPTPFDVIRQIPFRISMDLPPDKQVSGNAAGATASPAVPMPAPLPDNAVILKELRFDRLNDRQIEVNVSVQVNGAVIRKKQCPLIRNVGFVEEAGSRKERPGLVLYISCPGDTLWKIARKYRTTIDAVAKINGLEVQGIQGGNGLEPGTKLLIVK